LISALTIASVLNLIPLASLAAILLIVGYKLAKPALFKQMYDLGWEQFVPFTMTVIGIIATDLLKGIAIGMVFGIFFTLWRSYKISHSFQSDVAIEDGKSVHVITLSEQVSFFNKAAILDALENIPKDSKVIIDGTKSKIVAHDVIEIIENFIESSKRKNITVQKINI
jgi:MFS superfamily sulfate permease-like transporter